MSQPGRSEEDMLFEDRSHVQEAGHDDTAAPGLDARWRDPDPQTCAFQEPGEPPRTYWRGPNL